MYKCWLAHAGTFGWSSRADAANCRLLSIDPFRLQNLVTHFLVSSACDGCRHGFIGILVLAAWPNAAFDLCGICCGHFLMPFWEFFGATLIGKGLIKVRRTLPAAASAESNWTQQGHISPVALLPFPGCTWHPASVFLRVFFTL